jgi:hypothetical protein
MMAYAQHSGFFGLNDDDDDEDDEDYVDEDFGVDMDDDGAFMDDDDDEDGESANRYHDEFTELIYRRNFGADGHYHYSVRYPALGPHSHHLFPRTPTTGPGTTSNDPINLADDDDDEEATPAVTVIGSRSSTTRPSSSLPSSSVSSVTRASVDMRPPALQRLPRSLRVSASSAVIDLTDEQDKDDYALSRSSTSGTSGSTDISQRSDATTSTAQSGVDSLMDSFCVSQADTIASASAKAPAVSISVPKENGIHVTNDDDDADADDGADAITDSSFPSGAGHRRRRIRRSLANRLNDDDDDAWFLDW